MEGDTRHLQLQGDGRLDQHAVFFRASAELDPERNAGFRVVRTDPEHAGCPRVPTSVWCGGHRHVRRWWVVSVTATTSDLRMAQTRPAAKDREEQKKTTEKETVL
jgi:hypothetical protein